MILRERDYVANRRNEQGSQDKVAQVTGPIFDEGDISETAEQGQPESYGRGGTSQGGSAEQQNIPGQGNGNGNEPVGAGDNRQGDYSGTTVAAATPKDIPSGDDDDVVARQIREAAMREKDPKLRDKLWDEYRKYKNQAAKDAS